MIQLVCPVEQLPLINSLRDKSARDDGNPQGQRLIECLHDQSVDNYSLAMFWVTASCYFGTRVFEWKQERITEKHMLEPESLLLSPDSVRPKNVFEEIILGLTDKELLKLLQHYWKNEAHLRKFKREGVGPFQSVLARDKPEIITQFIEGLTVGIELTDHAVVWQYVIAATEVFDERCVDFFSFRGLYYPLIVLDILRRGQYSEIAIKVCATASASVMLPNARIVLSYLLQKDPKKMLCCLEQVAQNHSSAAISNDCWREYYSCALKLRHYVGVFFVVHKGITYD